MSGINISTKLYQLLKKEHDGMFFEYEIESDTMKVYRDYFQCDEDGVVIDIENYTNLIIQGDKIHEDSKQQYLDCLKSRYDSEITILRKNNGEARYKDEYIWFKIKTYYTSEDNKPQKTGHILCIHEEVLEKERLKDNRFIDVDTGLYTKAYTDEKMDDYISIGADDKSALILMDIDHFSDINDTYGAKFADALLAEMADLLRLVFGRECIIGRCGGDVFAVLAKHSDAGAVMERAMQVLEGMKELYCGENKANPFTASIALVDTDDAADYYSMYDLGVRVISYIKSLGGGMVKSRAMANEELEAPVEHLFPRRHVKERGIDKHSVSQDNMVAYAMSLMEDTHDIESSIKMLLCRMGRKYGADRVSVISMNWETLDFRYAYQWSYDLRNDMSGSYSKISIRDYYMISTSYNEYGFKEYSGHLQTMMKSCIEAAIYNKGRYSGALRIEIDREHNIWTDELRTDLPLLASLIGTYIGREAEEKNLLLKQFEMDVMSTAIKGGMKIVLDDRDRTILNISESLCELFGYTVDEMLGVTDGVETNLIYPEDLESVKAQTNTELIHDTDSYTLKYRVKCKDGSLKWVLDYGRRVKDIDGRSVFYTTCTDVTEIEESAQQIRELYEQSKTAEECTRIALQNTKTTEFFYYPEERRMVLPERSRKLIGCKGEYVDMPYDFAAEIVSPEMQRSFIKIFNSVSGPGSTAVCEFRVKDTDNWIRITLSAMEIENSSTQTVVGIAEDISDETSAAQERMRIIDSISDSYFAMYHIKPSEGTYAAFSQTESMSKVFGNRGSISSFMDLFEKEFIQEEGYDNYRNIINRKFDKEFLNEKHRTENVEYRHNYGDHIGWVRASFVLVAMKGDKIDSFMLTFMDIDEERRRIEEQQKEHTILSLAISGSYDMIHEINLDTDEVFDVKIVDGYAVRKKNTRGNTELVRLMGEKFIHPEEQEEYKRVTAREYIDMTITPETPELYTEFRVRKGIGSEEYVWKSFLHRLIPDSPTKSIMQFTNDITQRKTQELETRKALKDAFDMANSANNAKSDFLSKMSHDIRTPMNAIIGMTSIAQSHISDEERVEDCLKKIDMSSKHLLGLINDVLDMSKIESGKMELIQEEVNISELIDGIVTMLRPSVEQKGHTFDVEFIDVAHKDIIGDGLRMRQIFVNLLSNAIKYTPDGGCVEFKVIEKPSEYSDMAHYEFRIKDNGIGMTPEYLEKLFEPFVRAEDSRTSKIQGTGLGMTITKQLINMMEGSINVVSEVNKGSEFIVTLFFKLQNKDYLENESAEETVATDFTGKRILLVEDNEINMEIACEILSYTGADIETAADGQEAFEAIRDKEPDYFDMVLMDIQMPILNGYEATRAIRGLDRPDTNKLPIIACTANAFVEDIRDVEEAGMNGHVTKPIDFEQLLKVMDKWLN